MIRMLRLCLLLLIIQTPKILFSQWNPDAGVIPSYTWNATVITSSGSNGERVIDRDDQTNWQSGAPLPQGFLTNATQNVLKDATASGSYKYSSIKNAAAATDANLSSSAVISGSGSAWLLFPKVKSTLRSVSMKALVAEPLKVYARLAKGDSVLVGTFTSELNYKWKRFDVDLKNVSAIVLRSASEFTLYEVAAMDAPPVESAIVDFGQAKRLGWVETRHWAGGKAVSTKLYASADKTDWKLLADLKPDALLKVTTRLKTPMDARYVKVEHTLKELDYAKVFVWEVNAWDEYGPYGQMPVAKKNNSTVASIFGVNGIWGWGYDACSENSKEGEGVKKFNKIATHARNFHDWHWDVTDPDSVPDYSRMAKQGTSAIKWLNWDREYTAWQTAGLKVEVSIKYSNKKWPQAMYNHPYKAAYNYAFTFARHFGPSYGNGIVNVFEAGNEPWDYPAEFFTQIQKGMVEGAKAGDPKLMVLPCALQCGFPSEENEKGGNYAGARLTAEMAKSIDGFNAHHYCYAYDENAKRRGVHPEHPEASVRAIINDVRFRDANLPGKKIYVTEWGWDSDGAGESCTHSECVSELEQAIYGIRGALFFIRMGVDRLTWYFFANGNGGLYSRSGLLGSIKTNFVEKQSFRAFQAMLNQLGGTYFLNVIQENEQAWVYAFGDASGKTTHIVAWRPVAGSDTNTSIVSIKNIDAAPGAVRELTGATTSGELKTNLATYNASAKTLSLKVSAVPVVVVLEK